jgi:uncharacterized tellurite resistance protein B-like protein
MFDKLRRLLADLVEPSHTDRQFDENDHRIAAAALLVHVADIDGEIDEREQERLRTLVAERFDLDAADAAQLIREALWSEHEAVSINHFVNILKRALDANGRLRLVEMMWDVVFADGAAEETEDTIIWRLAGMLDVPEADQEIMRRSREPGHWPGSAA